MTGTATAVRAGTAPHRPSRRLSGLVGTPEANAGAPVHEGMLSRPRLVSRLAGARAPLVLLAAPAGYGKTTLLAEWQRSVARAFAWVTLEEHHNRGAALVTAIEQALDEAAPALPRRRGMSTRSRGSTQAVALPRLVRSLAARAPFVLVLDDLHALHTSGGLEAVRTLARHCPPECRLVLASRSEPALPTGRLRANRALTEIRARDLAMTAGEAVAVLGLSGLEIAAPEAKELAQRVEGWPTGVSLAATALRGQADLAKAVSRFGGDDAIVSDYLRDEVVERLPSEQRSFLMHTSVLDELSGPLCDAVLERSGSAQLLSSLGRADLLLVPLDRKDQAYRCHRLLAEMLRAELRRTQPDEEARLHRRASDWYSDHAEVDRAVHHALAAGDAGRTARLLGANAPAYVTQSRNGKMRRWLAHFTDEQLANHPELTLAAANSDLLEGRRDPVQRWESAARRVLHETPPRKRSATLKAAVAILRAVAGRDGLERMSADAAVAYELEPEDSPWRPLCCLLEGVARHLAGDRDVAAERLEEGARRGAIAAPNIQTLCLAQLALGASERDDWESAAAFSARAMAQVGNYALGDYPTSALVFAASSAARAHRGMVDEAGDDLHRAERLLERLEDFIPWYVVEARIALAGTALRLSDAAAAREHLAEASRLAARLPDAPVLHAWIAATEERLGVASHDPALLTTAELRILTFLPTHLSFREIAARLFVSANTVKSQAHAVYRKLDAGSRSEAVTRAEGLGLLDL